jgi:hypothetical protein
MTISSTAVSRSIAAASSMAAPALSIAASHASGLRCCAVARFAPARVMRPCAPGPIPR